MRAFPLIRTKLSNMSIMTVLFAVLLLYRIPAWIQSPAAVWDTLFLLVFALAVDAVAGFLRHKRPVCAVSGAVTAILVQLLTPGAPLWGEFVAVAFALLAGKHVWGGMGKNPVNPAMTGVALLALLFPVQFPPFAATPLLIPAMLLSLPFLLSRPFASLGMMAGMAAALALRPDPVLPAFVACGAVLWSCLVMTDPVTTTPRPLIGAAVGLLAGFMPLALGFSAAGMALGVLAANLLSFVSDRLNLGDVLRFRPKFRRLVAPDKFVAFHDLAGDIPSEPKETPASVEELLDRVERAGVFGFGGAAFPAARKVRTLLASAAPKKHLIVNAVECDPGLSHDKWLLHNRSVDIARGIELLCRFVPFASATIAVKHASIPPFPLPIAVRRVPDYYPAGAERLLIREVLGVTLAERAIPAEAGILVMNVQTVIAVYEAARFGRMADARYLTVANLRTNTVAVARVRLGTNVQQTARTLFPGAAPVFVGGGIMQASLAAEDAVIGETVNFIATGAIPEYRESPQCSRCGLCTAVCPAKLNVGNIAEHMRSGQADKAARLHPDRCMACGSCSRVCLAGRNLSAAVTEAKRHNQLIDCGKEAYNSMD